MTLDRKRAFRPQPTITPAYPTHDEAPTRRGVLARLGGGLGALVGALLWPERADASSRRPKPGKPKRKPKAPKRRKRPGAKKKPKKRRPPVYDGFAFSKPAPGDFELPRD